MTLKTGDKVVLDIPIGTTGLSVPFKSEVHGQLENGDLTIYGPDGLSLISLSPDKVRLDEEMGVKWDDSKPPLDLISPYAQEEEAMVLAVGAKKYGRGNWAKGIALSRLIAAAERHIVEIKKGVDIDPDTGHYHAAAVRANMGFILHFLVTGRTDLDDRLFK